MTWVKIDDAMPTHPKIGRVSFKARWLYITALCWCNQHETDGVFALSDVKRWPDFARSGAKKAIVELVMVGLFEEKDDQTYTIHDFTEYQPTREQIAEHREKNARRQSEWRERNAVTEDDSNAVSNALVTNPRNAPRARSPIPSHPIPISLTTGGSDQQDPDPDPGRRLYDVFVELSGGRFPSAVDRSQFDEFADRGCTAEHIDAALAEVDEWGTPPDHPWAAFKAALGRHIARSLQPEPERPAQATAEQVEAMARDTAS